MVQEAIGVEQQIQEMPADEIQTPDIPVDVLNQEAENLHAWATDDKDALLARGMNASILDMLEQAAQICRKAEANWYKERRTRKEAENEWRESAPLAYDLRNMLVAEFQFAFFGRNDLLGRVNETKDGDGHADMIQDLINLAVLGKENIELLNTINFDTTLIEKAETTATQIAKLLAEVNGEKNDTNEAKIYRDKAYTFLKQQVDEVRRYGKFVFRNNKDRIEGYYNHYKMR